MAKVKIIEKRMTGTLEETLSGKKRMINIYDIAGTTELINECLQAGYELKQLSEGSLGNGDCVLLAPDETFANFVIREVYINEWTSGQTIKRCKKLSKAILAEIAAAEKRMEREQEEAEEAYRKFRQAVETARNAG